MYVQDKSCLSRAACLVHPCNWSVSRDIWLFVHGNIPHLVMTEQVIPLNVCMCVYSCCKCMLRLLERCAQICWTGHNQLTNSMQHFTLQCFVVHSSEFRATCVLSNALLYDMVHTWSICQGNCPDPCCIVFISCNAVHAGVARTPWDSTLSRSSKTHQFDGVN